MANPYRAQGVELQKVETLKEKARADAAEKANNDLRASIDAANAKAASRASAAKAKIAALKAKEASAEVEITRLQALAAGVPAPTKEADCAETNKLIDAVIAERLRSADPASEQSAPSVVP